MLRPCRRYLGGYLEIVITGGIPEALVNLAVGRGIDLWDLSHGPEQLVARLPMRDFPTLRPLCRRVRCRARIRRRFGFPFLWRRLVSRRGLVVGGLAVLALVVWFSAHIWVVDIRGAELMDPRAIRAVAGELGLRPGVWRSRVRVPAVEQEMPLRLPGIAWATLHLQGTRAVLEVVERAEVHPLPGAGQRVDVVARSQGLIEQVVAFQGYPRVRRGDVVVPGQLLVEGVLWVHSAPVPVLPGIPKPPPDRPLRVVQARARVLARRWHQAYVEVPLVRQERAATGRTASRWAVRIRGREFVVKGPRHIPYAHANVTRKSWSLPGWRNWWPPVEISSVTAAEIRLQVQSLPSTAVRAQATQRLLDRVQWHLGPGDRVLGVTADRVQSGPDFAGFQVTVETLEDIGRPQASQQGLPGPATSEASPESRTN